ncbi:MAG: hypothetical protein CMF59_16605 [Leptospiraceae bacterium]|nr:hypothetical protein [Leptospiraceae bacterium]
MSFIQDIVVQISNVTTNLRGLVFDPIIIGTGATARDTVTVSTLQGLVDAGYASTDEEYKALSAMLSNDIAPQRVIVRRKADATTYTDELDALVAAGTAWYMTTLTSRAVADQHEVIEWCQANNKYFVGANAAISARGTFGYQEWHFTSAKSGGDSTGLDNDATVFGITVSIDGGADQDILVTGSAAQTWTTLLSEINNDLSGATAELVDGNFRITSDEYGTSSSVSITDDASGASAGIFETVTDAEATVETAVAGTLRSENRGALAIHNNQVGDYPDMQWVGLQLPKQPGSTTWKWKRLTGQNAGNWTLTELIEIRGSGESGRAQALQADSGATYMNEGIALGGRFIDDQLGQDWVKDQIQLEILNLMLTTEKVSLDDAGIAQVVAVIRTVLERAGRVGIIARVGQTQADQAKSDDKRYMFKITAPTRSELSTSDLSTRTLNGITFTYYKAGAIHGTGITGIVTD